MSIIVTIEDHGVGVPEEMRETLFQPFRQAQRMTGGTGLGLYSLFKRVEALGGDCGVKARNDGTPGSSFWFSFPYRPDPNAVIPSSRSRNASLININYNRTYSSRDPLSSHSGRLSLHLRNRSMSIRSGPRIESMFPNDNDSVEVRPALRPVDDRIYPSSSTNGSIVSVPVAVPTDTSPSNIIDVVTFQNTSALSPLLTVNASVPGPGTDSSKSPLLSLLDQPDDGALRVLLTDDAPTILKVCKRMLQTNGHAVQTAVNGHQSLEKLKTYYTNNECDVLLTDLQMPVSVLIPLFYPPFLFIPHTNKHPTTLLSYPPSKGDGWNRMHQTFSCLGRNTTMFIGRTRVASSSSFSHYRHVCQQ